MLKNLQLDYCLDNAYKIIFNPTNQLLPPTPNEKVKEEKSFEEKVLEEKVDETPFLQFIASQEISLNKNENEEENKLVYSLYPQIAIIIQEFDVRINTILINSLISIISKYSEIFFPSEDDNNELSRNDDKDNNKNKMKDGNLIIDKYNDEYYIKLKEKLLNKDGNITNLVINYLTLSALKANLTFKVNKNTIEIKKVPQITLTLIKAICYTLGSFTDATIKLNEITFSNVFSDLDSLTTKILSFYKSQIISQLYKIILNIDVLGNPINYLEGVGTGIYNLFDEPRKGLLKGPEEFRLGMSRGVKGLVSNVVGGGFNSLSKVYGTLLNTTHNLASNDAEEEVVIKEEEKPKGLFRGAISGFKKGFGEIKSGVTGMVTKPIEQSKKGGIGGFFKGVHSGIVGAVLAPVNTVLTVGNEITTGISNSDLISNKKQLRRYRAPRTLYKYLPISVYDEIKEMKKIEQKKELEDNISLNNEKLFLENSNEIVLFLKLKNEQNLLFTNVMIKIMDKDCKKFVDKIYVCDIKEKNEINNDVKLVMKDENEKTISLKNEKGKNSFIMGINKFVK